MRKTLFVVSCLLYVHVAVADVSMTLHVRSTDKQSKGASHSPKKASGPEVLNVTLGKTQTRIDDGDLTVVYDFASRRIISVDRATKTGTNRSLYSDVAGRSVELENRKMLGKALDAGGVSDNPLALPLAENDLSMRAEDSKPKIKRVRKHGEVRFTWKGHELFAYDTDLIPLDAARRHAFVRLVRYHFGGHPEILDALQRESGIPRHFRVTTIMNTTDVEVSKVETIPDVAWTPPAFTEAKSDDAEGKALATAIDKVRGGSGDAVKRREARLLASADSDFAAKKYLPTMLDYLEYSLVSGSQLPDGFAPRKSALFADADVQRLVAVLSPQSGDAAKRAVKTLEHLRAAAGDKAYVLGIFEANIQVSLGKSDAAVDNFLAALAGDPWIAGVWKDLGNVYLQGFRADLAWECWDSARAFAPEHPMLQEIDRLEDRLAHDHPEYF